MGANNQTESTEMSLIHEVKDSLTRLEGWVQSIAKKQDEQLSGQSGVCVRQDARIAQLEAEAKTHKENVRWLTRTVVGALLTNLIALVVGGIIGAIAFWVKFSALLELLGK